MGVRCVGGIGIDGFVQIKTAELLKPHSDGFLPTGNLNRNHPAPQVKMHQQGARGFLVHALQHALDGA